ncbi:unnamed protein product (macronuclear) [Paramecium tetraurelia]|uniref:MORN repeat protein n=1 Tax=Paramecium tetraurelia TaxID=5888 RepID=A0EIH8_PARTE|nr:uncharacterized protein GSPATT00027448001 [Paramecium tetraurelia]CAK95119.1 unnamed protein product [Paramecium tetraurelia]|eukprot:XP_001462492.1 hypothetical protein (macronuclear) [Paramecium tetraurelia strain d4-2]
MQIVRLNFKADTCRNRPLKSPEKRQTTTIQFPNYIFLGPSENIKIVKFSKTIISSSIKLIRSTSPQKIQNISLAVEFAHAQPKHQKTQSVQLSQQNVDQLFKAKFQNHESIQGKPYPSTKYSYGLVNNHKSEMTLDTISDYPNTPTLTVPALKVVDKASNVWSGNRFNLSKKITGQIQFQNGFVYEGELLNFDDTVILDGQGTLYSNGSKLRVIYEGRWKNNLFHGKGKYFNQYQIESSKDWHFNWRMIQGTFNNGEIIQCKIDFFLSEEILLHNIDYQK